ncbi:Arylsulfatase (AS) (Aryl-sulfate sulphohydrolase) [Scheffersomyces stipitis CBS 6054]|uniref:Arylsulfatase (AS) (Aryl-sulfate sulphohydrolase) n=1 Tax=Scheffersomyces stipitis (strain ATCC 58785 / CBS 6054 / NBRC 10063 / NRRL Y-11545) TaxID=322104 RepID=A3LZV3_PICST|nr:Arylsulfatase (AS) (Aryl-sulfate sulphohydrolase) [Scheffersomyces stipitis CBS 6054]ABN68605.1 Arylsulfatase (AS) (Aryl-sulfate sulphohydrolase) [Scheffersomyces stipitis CBS 6054]
MTVTAKKPNFLVIVADDLGFTDLSAFGGEIHTPNLQKLADRGVRLTDFHTASACSPTRSMLFSGTDNHIAGLGQMAEFASRHPEKFAGKKGYEGYLNDRVVALPEILKEYGDYFTFISGKWHLGLLPEYWPSKRGFEKSFTLLPGAGNHYKYITKDENGEFVKFLPPLFAEDDRSVDAEKELPEDFYSTDYFTDKGIEFITSESRNGRPFFGCLTYTAPHWPYQAPQSRIDKYKGVYDGGPEELRRRRLASAAKIGIIPEGVVPHPIKTIRKRWSELTENERKIEARIMETYAAMVEILDENIGRVVDHLEKTGELDNTFILFMSDNGAEGMLMEALPLTALRINTFIEKYYNNALDNIGKKDSFVFYGDQWAQAATSPHSMYKMWSTEGAIVCPLIIHYPPLLKSKQSKILDAFTTVMDILPTVLELADVKHPGNFYKGREVAVPRGSSWVSYLADNSDRVHQEDTVTGWELFGQQAIRKGSYKALYIPAPFGPEKWQLFNIKEDPGETKDLAETETRVLSELINLWAVYAAETGLIELGSDLFEKERIEGEENEVIYRTILDS